jgi:hypothetical protein
VIEPELELEHEEYLVRITGVPGPIEAEGQVTICCVS